MTNTMTIFGRLYRACRDSWLSLMTLVLGVAACSLIFAIFNAAFFQPLSIAKESEVVVINTVELEEAGQLGGWSFLNFIDLRHALGAQQLIQSMVALDVNERMFASQRQSPTQPVRVAVATQGLTRTLGVVPILGQDFSESDEMGRGELIPVLISERLWRAQFDANPAILGRSVYLDGQARRVIGVLPAGLIADSQNPIDCWVSTAEGGDSAVPGSANASRSYPYLSLALVRLAPGVPVGTLTETAQQRFRALASAYPAANAQRGIAVSTLRAYLMRAQQPMLQLLVAMAVVVALMVCLNLANVSLARAAKRAGEYQTRIHLGAGLGRLLAGVLSENLKLGLVAALLALPLVALGLHLAEPLIRSQLENLASLRVDWRVLSFTLLLSMSVAVLSSLAPVLFMARLLQQRSGAIATRANFGSRSQQAVRKLLVTAQLALTFGLLIAAALLVQSLRGLSEVNPGFAVDARVVLSLQLDGDEYEDPVRLSAKLEQLKASLLALPGVRSLSFAQALPLGQSNNSTQFDRVSQPFPRDALPDAGLRFVDPDYATTLAIPMREGRFFGNQDQLNSPAVVVINQAFAKRYFPQGSALGQRLSLGWGGEGEKTIVGVISDVRHAGLSQPAEPEFFVPLAQFPLRSLKLVAHVQTGSESTLANSMRAAVSALDPQISLGPVTTMAQLREVQLAQPAFLASVISVMALVALTLGAVGLFALLSYLMQLRAGEFALRLALGAQRRAIWILLYRQLAALWLGAVLIGAMLAVIAPLLLRHWLFDFSGNAAGLSLGTCLAALGVLSVAMCGACLSPSYRAARTSLRDGLSGA